MGRCVVEVVWRVWRVVRRRGLGGFGIWVCQRMCCRSLFGFKTHIYVVVQQIFRVFIA